MYSRGSAANDAGDGADTFGVSGNLWHGVLVMYDRGTGSLWTQLEGRAIEGPRAGESLEHVESTHTTWAAWKEAHPDTVVLEKSERALEMKESNYADYFADPDRLFRPELNEGLGGVGPKDVVYGVLHDAKAIAVTEAVFASGAVVNGVVASTPIAWRRDPRTGAVSARRRDGTGRVLVLIADDDGAVLDARSGAPLDWDAMPRLRVDRSFWYAWKRTHAESSVITR